MSPVTAQRKLAAILSADVVGYSRLMNADEEATLHELTEYRDLIHTLVEEHQGRLFGVAGDSLMAEFNSPRHALSCAVQIQQSVAFRNNGLRAARHMRFRIGVNLGDVLVEGGNLYGDGVNVAARLEEIAEPGGVCISGLVRDSVGDDLPLAYDFLGEKSVKNIADRLRVYRVRGAASGAVGSSSKPGANHSSMGIAVLPFSNLSGDAEKEYFCDGITVDITTDLSKFPMLRVISTHSAFTYKGQHVKAQDVGRLLGVAYLLEGSVGQTRETVRINAQLVDAGTGRQVWVERFVRPLDDLLVVQDEIIQRIVAALALKVSALEREAAMRKAPHDINAHDAVLRGAHLRARGVRDSLQQSEEWLRRALQLDPEYARVWAELSHTCIECWMRGWNTDGTQVQALDYGKKGVFLDPGDYDTHWALAYVYLCTGCIDQALKEYEEAFELNPNDPDLLAEMSEALCFAGYHEDAIEKTRQAILLNPYAPDWYRANLAQAYYFTREYDKSIAQLTRIIKPDDSAQVLLAASYAQLDRHETAQKMMEELAATGVDRIAPPHAKLAWFKKPEDRAHWLDGVRKAGIPGYEG